MPVEQVYGLHAVRSILEHDAPGVLELWIQDLESNAALAQIRALAEQIGLNPQPASRKTLDRLSNRQPHQGVVLRYRSSTRARRDFESVSGAWGPNALVLVLDGVLDPRNLGACLRSADAAGVDAVVVSRNRSAALGAAARKAASGAAETVAIIEVSNLVRALERMKGLGLALVGACGDVETSIYDLDLKGGIALILGGEEKGLRRLTRESCDHLAHIPMHGRVESLNVSVAAAVCLFEARRQRA